jgi:hypothetical protein
VVVCIALGVDDVSRGSLLALIYLGDKVTWKVLAGYSWNPTTTQSSSFLCTAASSTPIRVVTREARYIHELSLTLEHSMLISSPTAPGLIRVTWNVLAKYCWRPTTTCSVVSLYCS